ncbi:hypothetical protein ABTK05_20115, partial [Acinetobacter baumannii]
SSVPRPVVTGVDGIIDAGSGSIKASGSANLVAWRKTATGIAVAFAGQSTRPLIVDAIGAARPVTASREQQAVVVEDVANNGVSRLLVASP